MKGYLRTPNFFPYLFVFEFNPKAFFFFLVVSFSLVCYHNVLWKKDHGLVL